MSDNILSAVLTFSLLASGTVAIGSELLTPRHAAAHSAVATLPAVTIVGKRVAAADTVTLPTVVVTGRRQVTAVAIDDTARDSRVQ
jgi:hypothetical protein